MCVCVCVCVVCLLMRQVYDLVVVVVVVAVVAVIVVVCNTLIKFKSNYIPAVTLYEHNSPFKMSVSECVQSHNKQINKNQSVLSTVLVTAEKSVN